MVQNAGKVRFCKTEMEFLKNNNGFTALKSYFTYDLRQYPPAS